MNKKSNHSGKLNILWLIALVLVAVSGCKSVRAQQFFGPEVAVVERIPVVETIPKIQVVTLQVEYVDNSNGSQSPTQSPEPGNTLRITKEVGGKYSLTYGGRGWGSLGSAQTAAEMIRIAEEYAQQTSSVLDQELATIINPNICQGSRITFSFELIRDLVSQAQEKGYKVMFDINTGTEDPELVCITMIDQLLLGENVYFDLDIEHTNEGGMSGQINSSTLNRIIEYYSQKRNQLGYQSKGIFAFYLFRETAVINPTALRLDYDNVSVVPIADGYGILPEKQIFADWLDRVFGRKGIMEFNLKHGQTYDKDGKWQELFKNNHDAVIFAHQ